MGPQTTGPEQLAQEIIAQAKHIISDELGRGLEVTMKADNSPVTQIDTHINELAIELICKQFPDDAIYAEEGNGGGGTSGYTWVIDPIDGTHALEMGMPTYTVCIARVAPDGVPDLSYVYNPSTDDSYAVRRGEKAMKNGDMLVVKENASELSGELVYVSSRMPEPQGLQSEELCRRLEAAGAERINTHAISSGVLLVAEGKAVAAIAGTSKPYELASVKPLVEGAGGIVSDLEGNPIERCDSKIGGFIAAANKKVLQAVLDIYRGEAHNESHMQVIHTFAHDACDIRPVRGYVNDVYIVDEKYVFRFPKDADWREMLLYEVAVLRSLEGHVTLRIPVVQYVKDDGAYAVYSYVNGNQRNLAAVQALSAELKREFARGVAGFLTEMNDAVSRDWMQEQLVNLPVARKDEAEYYTKLLALGRENSNPYVDEYEYWYDHLMAFRDIIFSPNEVVIHGDLHNGNFIFDNDNHLTGILDFGDCMLNTVYFELRQLYHFGEDILDMIIEALNGRFGTISKDAVRVLAVAHELSILMRLGSPEETPYDKDRGAIARKLLQQWGEL